MPIGPTVESPRPASLPAIPGEGTRGFTLVELLVVIGIVALLISILLPAVNRARRVAAEVKSLSGMRQLMYGYTAYHTDNRGRLLYGYPPDVVDGKPVTADDPITGYTYTGVVAARYPWRIVKYCANVWTLLHAHAAVPPLPQKGDVYNTAFSKAYTLGINPTYGINATFVGGFKDGDGFTAAGSPNVGKHVAFKASDVHRPTELLVFADCYAAQAQLSPGEKSGYAVLTPPRAGGLERWTVERGVVRSLYPASIQGLPNGWFTKNVVTGFFDGHAEALRPDQLLDMRRWCDRATTPDYDYK